MHVAMLRAHALDSFLLVVPMREPGNHMMIRWLVDGARTLTMLGRMDVL